MTMRLWERAMIGAIRFASEETRMCECRSEWENKMRIKVGKE